MDQQAQPPAQQSSFESQCRDALQVQYPLQRPASVCIFRVPELLKDLKREAYVPRMVSLGPCHSDMNAQFPEMNSHKAEAVRRMLNRLGRQNIEYVIDAIYELIPEIMDSYEQLIQHDGKTRAWILTFDGCFILEILRSLNVHTPNRDHNIFQPIFDTNRIEYAAYEILTDMFMLENQIPLCVLLKLLELEILDQGAAGPVNENPEDRLADLLFKARLIRMSVPLIDFSGKRSQWLFEEAKNVIRRKRNGHLLSLFSSLIISSLPNQSNSLPPDALVSESPRSGDQLKLHRPIPSASELHNARIQFKSYEGGLGQIAFDKKGGTLKLPTIRLSSSIETVLRNLMALEMCQPSKSTVISCYLILMDELIDNGKDVALLRKADIIRSHMGSDKEVADLFNCLCKGITRSRQDNFAGMKEDVDDYYHSKWNVMLAEFMKEHFPNPWRPLSVMGAILLLLFTAVQTIYSLHRRILES